MLNSAAAGESGSAHRQLWNLTVSAPLDFISATRLILASFLADRQSALGLESPGLALLAGRSFKPVDD